jgi:hypothetical protein
MKQKGQNKVMINIIIKIIITSILALCGGFLRALILDWFNKDLAWAIYFTIGWLDCVIANWRW